MGDTNNIRIADIEKLVQLEKESRSAIEEFDRIKDRFQEINETLLSKWKGAGAVQYKNETDNILEKVIHVSEVLDAINNGVLKDIKETYLKLDEDLGAFNENPTTEDGE